MEGNTSKGSAYLHGAMHTRKTEYEIGSSQDEFMVPILRARIEELMQKYANPVPLGGRSLDAGCGRQPFRKHLESMGYSYTGLDVEQNPEGAIDIIGSLGEALSPEQIGVGPFDIVLCTEVLEHIADWGTAFANLAMLTRQGGRVILTCPHFFPLHEEPYDFWRPTVHAIRHFAVKAGFIVLDEEKAGDVWDVLGTLWGSCYPWPASAGLRDRVIGKLAKWFHRYAFRLLAGRKLQQMVQLRGQLYLANIFVLERAAL